MRSSGIALATLTLLLAGCGSEGSDSDSTTSTQATVTAPAKADIDRQNYDIAKTVCGAFPIKKVASDLGINTTDVDLVAKAYAEGLQPEYQQAAYEGCIEALIANNP